MDLGNFEEAVRDYEKASTMDKNRGNVQILTIVVSICVKSYYINIYVVL